MTVKEIVEKEKGNYKSIWLCPDEHSSQAITPLKYECGMTYEKAVNIPDVLINKEVKKAYIEKDNGKEKICVIWKNINK